MYVCIFQELSAQTVFNVLKKVSDEDVHKIGFDPKWARPEWMLVSVLPGEQLLMCMTNTTSTTTTTTIHHVVLC